MFSFSKSVDSFCSWPWTVASESTSDVSAVTCSADTPKSDNFVAVNNSPVAFISASLVLSNALVAAIACAADPVAAVACASVDTVPCGSVICAAVDTVPACPVISASVFAPAPSIGISTAVPAAGFVGAVTVWVTPVAAAVCVGTVPRGGVASNSSVAWVIGV